METICKTCKHELCIKKVPLFSSLNEQEMEKVASFIRRKQYKKGETLFLQGNAPKGLIIINRGTVKAYTVTAEGKEQILHLFFAGDFFGEKNLFLDKPMKYHVEAVEDTHICMISKKDFQEIVENHPIMTGKMMAALVERIDRLEDMVENMGAQEIEKRLIEVLVEFARSSDEEMKNNMEIVIPLSREGIANYIGSTRETVSRKLNLLKAEGLIDFVGNKKIRIKDIDLLTKR